jgi:hypothetical protein
MTGYLNFLKVRYLSIYMCMYICIYVCTYVFVCILRSRGVFSRTICKKICIFCECSVDKYLPSLIRWAPSC